MISTTLCMWGNGAVTLPKKWRDRFQTKNFLAEEDASGNLTIKPVEDIVYYERKDGSYGLHFPRGIEAGKLANMLRTTTEKFEKEERLQKKTKLLSRK